MRKIMLVGLAAVASALVVSTAAASIGPAVAWTRSDMTAAVKALGYPRPHAQKVSCRGLGAPVNGRYASFRCVATYQRRPHRRVFYAAGRGEGGWLCAAAKLASCKLLRHGFVSTATANRYDNLGALAKLASIGYVQNKYSVAAPQSASACQQAGASSWTCGYQVQPYPAGATMVTVTFKPVRGGWTIGGSG